MKVSLKLIGKAKAIYLDTKDMPKFLRNNRSLWEIGGAKVARVFKPVSVLREVQRTDKVTVFINQYTGLVYAERV